MSDKHSGTPAKPSLKKIVVPLDGSALGEAALPHAEELAKMAGAEIILVHVVAPQHYEITLAESLSSHLSRLSQEYVEHATAAARDYLGLVAKRLTENGIAAQVIVEVGSASDKILACARKRRADMIALSTH